MGQAFPALTFGHAAQAFAIAHAAPGAWSAGTAVKYRQTLGALGRQLAETVPAADADIAVPGTPPGASALQAAFTAGQPPGGARRAGCRLLLVGPDTRPDGAP